MNISFYTSWSDKCGIADYSRYVTQALKKQETTVTIVPVPDRKNSKQFISTGRKMNLAQVAHIQHEYAFFSDSRLPVLFPFLSAWHFFLFLSRITIPKIVTLHEVMSSGITSPLKRFAALLFLKGFALVLNRCDRIIVHTGRFRDILIRHGVHEQRVLFIPHPFPAPAKLPENSGDAVQAFKQSYGLEGKTVLTIFGFVYPRKGYEIALSALKDLDDCILLIAGGPHPIDTSGYYERLVSKITELRLNDKVRLLDYIAGKDIDTVMLATDIFLAPYLDAPGSGSLSRMSVYHKPIIASDIPTVRELKDRGFGVELCEPGNSRDLHDAVQRLLTSEDRKNQLIRETERFVDRHSYDSFAKTLITLTDGKSSG